MRSFPIIILATLALGGSAMAAEQGASSKAPATRCRTAEAGRGAPAHPAMLPDTR